MNLGDIFVSMLYFALFFIWIWMLVVIFGDIFRSDDLGGGGKALWCILIIIFPYLGVFVYLIVRGRSMGERAQKMAQAQDAAARAYIQSAVTTAQPPQGGATSPAEEIDRLAKLRASGVISETEFQQGKAKVLG
jgi:hypothetical protein